jgi:hypothetical protein
MILLIKIDIYHITGGIVKYHRKAFNWLLPAVVKKYHHQFCLGCFVSMGKLGGKHLLF